MANDELIDTQELAVKTPQAQSAAANIQGRKPGTCEYWAELVNNSGKELEQNDYCRSEGSLNSKSIY
jgi:hypothetical protein